VTEQVVDAFGGDADSRRVRVSVEGEQRRGERPATPSLAAAASSAASSASAA
jgi:hypothetical protein